MDPGVLATSAIAFLVPYLAKAGKAVMDRIGNDVAEAASSRVDALYQAIKRRLGGDDYGSQSLKRLEEKPDLEERQAALKGVLKEQFSADTEFRTTMERLVAEAQRAAGTTGPTIVVSGSGAAATQGGVAAGQGSQAAGGNIVNYGRGPREQD
jgi:cation diffusion facilitator CzcD-associated flavoprotein CzcO